MNKQNAEKYFVKQMTYWSKRLKLQISDVPIKDDKSENIAYVRQYGNLRSCWYNPNRLKNKTKSEILNIVFHELGHFKHNVHYDTFDEAVNSEYVAEKQGLKWMKMYYLNLYNNFILKCPKIIKRIKNKSQFLYYYRAFSKIKEYC